MAAQALWAAGIPVAHSPIACTYLEARACKTPSPDGDLRFHPRLGHPSGHTGPGLVALVTHAVTQAALSLLRTWLLPDGSGKAELDKPRLLWPGLEKANGVVRLWPDDEVSIGLAIAEGIETALSAARGFGRATWATIDAGGMATFPVLDGVEALTIFEDHDFPNPKTGRRPGSEAANACAQRWAEAGREVRICRTGAQGEDFNDFAIRAAAG